jgi:hypothetical protein
MWERILTFGSVAGMVQDLRHELEKVPGEWDVTRDYFESLMHSLEILGEFVAFVAEIADDEDEDDGGDEDNDNEDHDHAD